MSKFKIGEKVICTDKDTYHGDYFNAIGKVTEVMHNGKLYYVDLPDGKNYAFFTHELDHCKEHKVRKLLKALNETT